jgi:hypothetical protein
MADPKAAALELARSLRALGDDPKARLVLRGLEAALPEAAALVRGALEDPAGALGAMAQPMVDAAAAELADADRTIAVGIAKALGRGVLRGVRAKKP